MNVKRLISMGILVIGLLVQPETYASNPVIQLKIYQNDILGVLIKGNDEKINLRISNSLGEILYKESTIVTKDYGKGFDFKKLNDGVYEVKLSYGNIVETHEFKIKNGKVTLF